MRKWCGMQPESTLHMVLRLRGGMYHETSGRQDNLPLESEAGAVVVPPTEYSEVRMCDLPAQSLNLSAPVGVAHGLLSTRRLM